MATLSPTVSLREPKIGGGGVRPPLPGGGGGNGGDGNGYPDYGGRLRRARVGLLVALAPILMLFVAFTSALVMRRGLPMMVDGHAGQYVHDWLAVNLPMALLLVNTGLIVLSSLTMELARRQITRRTALAGVDSIPGVSVGNESNFPWLGVSMLLGIGFLVGQLFAWRELENRGFYLATSASSSFVYLLTATHGVHLFGGLVVMLYAQATSWLHKPVEERRIVVDVTAWYWHFMALLWIYVFALLWYAR